MPGTDRGVNSACLALTGTQKVYGTSAFTPNARYCYDGAIVQSNGSSCSPVFPGYYPYAFGRLTGFGNSRSTTRLSEYDMLGQLKKSEQQTGALYPFTYTYNAGGMLTSTTYPSGRVINYAPTTANRIAQITGVQQNVTTDYARNITYAPHGSPASLTQGPAATPFTQSWLFNDQFQMKEAKTLSGSQTLLKLTLDYGITNNNGNLRTQYVETGPKTFQQNFAYDAANRISNFEEFTLPSNTALIRQSFAYDKLGNQWSPTYAGLANSAVLLPASSNIVAAKNQISGRGYDLAGNLQDMGTGVGIHDAENRLVAFFPSGNGDFIEQRFDAEGRRVFRSSAAGATTYVYDAFGQLAAEYTSTAPTGGGGTRYLISDHLGSIRMVLDANGNCLQRSDYLPFGFEIWRSATANPCYGGDPPVAPTTTLRFTGLERDGNVPTSDSMLDLFGARYYSGSFGRFTSPDVPFADQHVGDPQSWNLYSYVRNNPMRFVDPSGRKCVNIDGGGQGDDGLPGDACPVSAGLDTTHGTNTTADFEPVPYIDTPSLGSSSVGPELPVQSHQLDLDRTSIGGCLVKGIVKGAAGTLVVGGLALGAVALGAPAAVVTGGLFVLAVAGGVGTGYSAIENVNKGNYAGVAYDLGSVIGGASVGWGMGARVGDAINPPASRGWSLSRDVANRFAPKKGTVEDFMATGPDQAAGAGAVTFTGSGISNFMKWLSGGC